MALPTQGFFRQLNGLSICSGAGGLELGLAIAEPGYRTVCYIERDSFAAATLVARMEDQALDHAPVWDDAKTFAGRPWRGKVDILSAGYPCQPFTYAGDRKGTEDPRHLWPHVERIIAEVRPRIVFCENVEGHLTLGFSAVAHSLQGMGFVVRAGLFSAAEAGASHQRRRLFILAHALGANGRQPERHAGGQSGLAVSGLCAPEGKANYDAGNRAFVDAAVVADADIGNAGRAYAGLPLFSPAPCELVGWEQILSRRPDLQPCLFGLDDGVATRMERSGLAGNGVCPMAAAIAYRTLSADAW